ncbi:MAG TPA: C1 family peptidase [Ktedonobacteraceae bacterium]
MSSQSRGLGWIPDLPDHRDHMYVMPFNPDEALPASVDLRINCPPVYDQGKLGSCTSNAIAGVLEFDQIKESLPAIFVPSRLFIYYNERVIEGTVSSDSGAQLRDGIKTVNKQGACSETEWPYDIGKFIDQPSDSCYQDALQHRALTYKRVTRDLPTMKSCLAEGYPFIFGFTVYESFESDAVTKTGIVPLPQSGEKVLGGHAVVAVGYDDSTQRFLVRNSWGAAWGQEGYFTMPYTYLTHRGLASDFWTVRSVD